MDADRQQTGTPSPDSGGCAVPSGWDASKACTIRPEAFFLTYAMGEIALAFARQQDKDQPAAPIALDECIILNPFVAKRLQLTLGAWVRHHENRYGPIEDPDRPTREPEPPHHPTPWSMSLHDSPAPARLLDRLVNSLGVPVGCERSFKISADRLQATRFLQGVCVKSLGPNAHEKLLGLAERLKMPDGLLEGFCARLDQADYVHFGFEQDDARCLYKLYLEFFEAIKDRIHSQTSPSPPTLLHIGFKWDTVAPQRQALTHYHWHPLLPVDQIHRRMSQIFAGKDRRVPLEIARGIVDVAARRIAASDIVYLEVTEAHRPRLSFDINLYAAGLRMAELYPFLREVARHYRIAPQRFETLYESVGNEVFGHISGGIDRQGKDFLTFYFGARAVAGDNVATRPRSPGKVSVPLVAGARRCPDADGSLLRSLINGLNVKVGFERSFKMTRSTLRANRFLAGLRRDSLGSEAVDRLEPICRQLRMPEAFIEAFADHLPEANIVLFGHEAEAAGCLYKAYLEFGDRIGQAVRDNPQWPDPVEIHLGFKWDPADPARHTTTRYTLFPGLGPDAMLQRLAERFYGQSGPSPYPIIEAVLKLAASRNDPPAVAYFEAQEQGNPRASFDLNLYMAKLQIRQAYPLLLEMARHYGIATDVFHGVYHPIGESLFGHLTGGTDRQGNDFLTIYHDDRAGATASGQPAKV